MSKKLKALKASPVENLPKVTRYGGNRLYVHLPKSNRPNGGVGKLTLKPAAYPLLEDMARSGRDLQTMAARLGIDFNTFTRLRRDDEACAAAIDRGHAGLGDELTDIFLNAAREGHIVAGIFLAKGRLGWRDNGPTDPNAATTQVNVQVNVPPVMSRDQFDALTLTPSMGELPAPDDEGKP